MRQFALRRVLDAYIKSANLRPSSLTHAPRRQKCALPCACDLSHHLHNTTKHKTFFLFTPTWSSCSAPCFYRFQSPLLFLPRRQSVAVFHKYTSTPNPSFVSDRPPDQYHRDRGQMHETPDGNSFSCPRAFPRSPRKNRSGMRGTPLLRFASRSHSRSRRWSLPSQQRGRHPRRTFTRQVHDGS